MANPRGGSSDEFVRKFRELFEGRDDCHGGSGADGRGCCFKEPLTPNLFVDHLAGRKRLGVYPLAGPKRDRCRWIAIDLDIPDWELALLFRRELEHFELHAYLEKSKGKGWHVWVFFKFWVEAWKARAVVDLAIGEVGSQNPGRIPRVVELFPKQDSVPEDGFGNYINLPLFGLDQKDGRTCFYDADPNGKPVLLKDWSPDQVVFNFEADLDRTIEIANLQKKTTPTKYERGEDDESSSSSVHKRYTDALPCVPRMLKGAPEGSRNEVAFRLSIHTKRLGGWTKQDTKNLLANSFAERCSPPMPVDEVYKTVDSAYDPRHKNSSYGCDLPAILPYCAYQECPVYRAAHPSEEAQRAAPTAPPPDPDKIHQINAEREGLDVSFHFARGAIHYHVDGLGNKNRSADLVAMVAVTVDGNTIERGKVNLDSQRARIAFDRIVFQKSEKKLTGVEDDLMNIGDKVKAQFKLWAKEKAEHERKASHFVMGEADEKAAKQWAADHPRVLYDVIEFTSRVGLALEKKNRCLLTLLFTSRLMKSPISGIGKGGSSSGKSFLASQILKLIPEEDVIEFTRMSAQAIFYRGEFSLQNKVLFVREVPGMEESQHALRTFMSEGDLRLSTVQKNETTGKNETTDYRIRGPLSFYTTTTEVEIHPENETRLVTIYSDESEVMTLASNKVTAFKAEFGSIDATQEQLKEWHNFQRVLEKNVDVQVPYAMDLVDQFPTANLRAKRDFSRMIEFIKSCAFLHQFHRNRTSGVDAQGNPYVSILASVADYQIVKGILEESLMKVSTGVKPGQERMIEIMESLTDTAVSEAGTGKPLPEGTTVEIEEDGTRIVWISSPALRKLLGKSMVAVRNLLHALQDEGVVTIAPHSRPLRASLGRPDREKMILPTIEPEELYRRFPGDRVHAYDPLSAPDFADIYDDRIKRHQKKEKPAS